MSTNALARPYSAPAPRRRKAPAVPPITRLPGIPFLDAAEIPDLFGMRISGDCLAPVLRDGDEVVFTRTDKPVVGQFAIFILRPEIVRPGGLQCAIKRLVMDVPPHVTLPFREHPESEVHAIVIAEQTNPHRQYMIKAENLLGIFKFSHVQNRQVLS